MSRSTHKDGICRLIFLRSYAEHVLKVSFALESAPFIRARTTTTARLSTIRPSSHPASARMASVTAARTCRVHRGFGVEASVGSCDSEKELVALPGPPLVVPVLDLLWILLDLWYGTPKRNYKWEFR